MFIRPADERAWIPWLTGFILVVLFLLAWFFPGIWSWSFNAVIYLDKPWCFLLPVVLLGALAVVSRFRSRLLNWNPPRAVQAALLLLIVAVFIILIAAGSVYVPVLEGDGSIDHDYAAWRWREVVVRQVAMPLLGMGEIAAALVTWRIIGALYILGALIFVTRLRPDFWSRFWSLALCAAVPQVISFTGHLDLYPITYFSLSLFLASLYLLARKLSLRYIILAAVSLYLSIRSVPYAVIGLLYPAAWLVVKFGNSGKRRLIICLFPFLVVLAGLIIPPLVHTERIHFGWGGWFSTVAARDGLAVALSHNINLHLSYLLPYLFAAVTVLITGWSRREWIADPIFGGAVLGSGSIFLCILAIELTTPLTGYGVREFLSLAGTFGGLFLVPMLIMLNARYPGRLYCFVIFSLFLTLPAIWLQRGPRGLERLRDTLAGDRGTYVMWKSPYLETGMRVYHSSWWQELPREEALALNRLGCEILEQGGDDDGFYGGFAPFNLYHAAICRYGLGDRAGALANLEKLLRRWPRSSLLLFGERWVTATLDPNHPDTVKPPANGPRDHDYWQSQLGAQAVTIASRLFENTGSPVYMDISRRMATREQRRRLQQAEMAAAVVVVGYHEFPSAERPYPAMYAAGIKKLEELGLLTLIEDR